MVLETPQDHPPAPRRACGILLIAGAVLLTAGTCGPAPDIRPAAVALDGVVMLDEPVVGALVRVEGAGGRVTGRDARTNDDGRFTIPVPASPAGYRVVATGGHTGSGGAISGTLAARVDAAGAARFVGVDPITTLADAYARANPSLPNAAALDAVGAFLAIPADVGVGSLVTRDAFGTSSPYFSRAAFARQAADGGGLDPFVASLVGGIQEKRTRRFVDRPDGLLRGPEALAYGVTVFVLNRALDRSGLLDKVGLGNPNETKQQIDEVKRSLEDVKQGLREIQTQIAGSTDVITNQVQELREFTAFMNRHAVMYGSNGHVTAFLTVRTDYVNFLTGSPTTITPGSVIDIDIQNRVLAKNAGQSFRDRVADIHTQIVPIEPVGGLSDGILTLLAKVARANGKPFSTVENYFMRLVGWETFAMGMFLDAKRYVSAPAEDIEAVKADFVAKLSQQRRMFLEAAEAYALYGGPISTTDAAVALAPLRRADFVANALDGATGWFTAAVFGLNDPVIDEFAAFADPYVRVDASSRAWPLDATLGSGGDPFYRRNIVYSLTGGGGATNGCYYYVGRDYGKRKQPNAFAYNVAGLGCNVRVLRYRASLALPPFMPKFGAIGDTSGLDVQSGGAFVSENVDLVTGAPFVGADSRDVSLTSHQAAYGSPTADLIITPAYDGKGNVPDPDRVVFVIPPNAMLSSFSYLGANCDQSQARFVVTSYTYTGTAPPRPELMFRRTVDPAAAACRTADCPAPGVAYAFLCPGSTVEQFMTPQADGRIGAGAAPFYFRLTKDRPNGARTRLSFVQRPGSGPAANHYVYLNVPASVGFFAALVGQDIVGKGPRELGAIGGERLQTGFDGWTPDVNGTGPITTEGGGEKRLTVRILGNQPITLSVSAGGRVVGSMMRAGRECNNGSPTLVGTFSADGADFARRAESMPGCSFFGTPPRDQNVDFRFDGTGAIASKAAGTQFDLVGAFKALLVARGGSGRIWMNANGNLTIEKLELTITNPGGR
jgi:hypothetical protein